jgi:hypothetical protein
MAAVAHGWKPPQSAHINIPQTVAKEYNQADKGSKMLSNALRNKK